MGNPSSALRRRQVGSMSNQSISKTLDEVSAYCPYYQEWMSLREIMKNAEEGPSTVDLALKCRLEMEAGHFHDLKQLTDTEIEFINHLRQECQQKVEEQRVEVKEYETKNEPTTGPVP